MSLRFFVEYNNARWFAIISGVDVPSIGYDAETDTGSIVLDIRYGDEHLLAMQHIHFSDDRIVRLQPMRRTASSPRAALWSASMPMAMRSGWRPDTT
jgi:hypothetical protein